MRYKRELLGALSLALSLGIMFTSCSKSDSSTGPGTGGTGSTITVAGKIIGINNQPVSGVPVVVAGIPSVNTDANGAFSIAGVTTPYSITVIDGANKQALVYRGLTRSDPTLMFFGATPGAAHSGTIAGKIYPATNYPEPAGRRTRVAFVTPEVITTVTATGATGVYNMSVNWNGPTPTNGTIYGLQWDYDAITGLPTAYRGYGFLSAVSLAQGSALSNVNDTLSVVTPTNLSGSVTVASGYTLAYKSVSLRVGGNGSIQLFQDPTASGTYTYVTPSITGVTLHLLAAATKSGSGSAFAFKTNLAPNASGVSVSVPQAPELSLPVDAATGVRTSTPFSWTPFTGGVHLLLINGPAGQPRYMVLTAAVGDSIPNLASAGLGLPSATTYSWAVYGFAPFASVDAAAGTTGFVGALTNTATTDGSYGVSVSRGFTTAP